MQYNSEQKRARGGGSSGGRREPLMDFAVGGQAVIEGVMMRSPHWVTVSVRKENGVVVELVKPFTSLSQKLKFLAWPFVRGVLNMIEMMIYGMHALNFSANQFIDEEIVEEKDKTAGRRAFEAVYGIFMVVFSLAFALFLFKFIPLWIATWLSGFVDALDKNYILFNAVDGFLKIAIFVGYIGFLWIFKDIRRVFEYHGAEHKAIFTYENKLPLSPENAQKMTRFHPRCGTSFILIVFLISIAVYTFLPRQPEFWLNLAGRIAVLPVIAGISYEILKLSARNMNNFFVRQMVKPGLWLQRLTTREPDLKQLEVALHALKNALEMENGREQSGLRSESVGESVNVSVLT